MANGFYDYLADIRPVEWFEYGTVLVLVMFFVTRIFRPSWMQLVAFAIGIAFIYYRTDRRRSTNTRAYTELKMRIDELYPKPQNFHLDVDVLNLFYNTKSFRKFHSEGYDSALVAVDNLLKLKSEMEGGIYHCEENRQLMRSQMNKALNFYQTIIFKIPSNLIFQRLHKRSLNALHILLRRHLDDVSALCIKQYASGPREVDRAKIDSKGSVFYGTGGEPGALEEKVIDIDWKPVYNDSAPRPDDTGNLEKSSFDFYY